MTQNLSDLLPAGASAKQLTFTDSGSGISSKAPVVLNSDGTVSSITGTAQSIGTADTAVSASVFAQNAAYDSNSNRIVVVYRDANPFYGKAVVGTPSGTSISWGTPVTFQSSSTTDIGICFDSTENKIVISYSDLGSSQYGKAIVGDVSGSTISFGSAATFDTGTTSSTSCVYDTSNNKAVIAYNLSGTGVDAVVATVSGTSISFGTPVAFTSNNGTSISTVFDSSANKVIITYADNSSSGAGTSVVGTVSGTSISFGSTAVWNSGDSGYQNSAYDASADRTLICYRDDGDSQIGKGIVAQVSGTSLTYGSETNIGTTNIIPVGMAYDPDGTQVLVAYGSANDSYKGKFRRATVSGLTVSFSEEFEYLSGTDGGYIACVYNTTDDKGVIIFKNDSASSYTQSVAVTLGATNLTAQAFVGVADSAISASAAGSVIVQGGTVSGLTDPFGTVTPTYGTPTAASAYQSESKVLAYDSANNRFVMAYKDGSNSDYGTAVVGELSGTSITWGTPVVFESATTGSNGLDIAFDSNVNRIVIAYQDQGNSSYGTAIVGSVSGTGSGSTIAFGSPTVFHTAETRYLSMTFDSNDNRIVIVYSDVDSSDYYVTYVIGTVTTGPDAISFNTPALLNGSARTYETSVSFDATENKVLVAYTDDSYDLYVLNLAISGGSGTPGTASSFGVGSPQQRFPRCVYDSVNGKSGVAYAEGTNLPIYFSVISMSGSNVTIETRVLAGDTSDSNYFMHNIAFDASIGQLAICTRDASASKGIAYYGSISGTTSSWTTSGSLFADETILTYGVDVAYDTSANKLAFVYSPSSGSDSAAVVGTLATTTLTIGSDYYVQTNGTLSTTSTSPAQLIGKAIKTNQINIKDYTG